MLRIAVLVSGGGTNLQAIMDAVADGKITNTEIATVISNNNKCLCPGACRKSRYSKLLYLSERLCGQSTVS